ncbi:MAG: peptidoglycan DD-metalloendopeptidase family protein [Clostridia bacterium]|nr:peptidoglycan DD-metalloendopeptidase family protein [Clostridia bacterium]
MQSKNKLTFHTALIPESKIVPEPMKDKRAEKQPPKPVKQMRSARLSASERLFRNTSVACALLLTVMALKNIDTPLTNKITKAVKSVVSMDMNLASSVGNLAFVQRLMPESALVFLNQTGDMQPVIPVKGEIVHSYTDNQPWLEYQTASNAPAYSASEGKVEACVQTKEGDITVLVKNSDGSECVYAFLESASVKKGDVVHVGSPIGATSKNEQARLYFEVRSNGMPIDPTVFLGS